ncbi:hypothetical protein G7Y89_g11085 [Cudoniella acicularis]|uniref:Tat pathway signal sequence n=1 Tax=Cudoniella acicularis TaxID=354080 RepID=A0A8H4RCK6_9HELO|nr:hypothetical protein G7Y89_g11085 [Cudoniella acicularis]
MAYSGDTPSASYEKLLPESDDMENADYQPPNHPNQINCYTVLPRWSIIHAVIIIIYILVFVGIISRTSSNGPGEKELLYSPARGAIAYETVTFHNELTNHNRFRGKPRPDLDAAWEEILVNTNVRVTADDLKKMNRNSVQLSDGSGEYMAGLDVHHQLHCLKMVYRALHPEYYHLPKAHMEEHIEHCLDSIRQFLMCKADISIVTYDWLDNHRRPFPNFNVQHECRSFEAIDAWAGERRLNIFDNSSLVHPEFGLSYPLDSKGEWMHGGPGAADPLDGKIITPPMEG